MFLQPMACCLRSPGGRIGWLVHQKAATFAGIAVGGDLTSRVVMVSGTDGDSGYLGQLANPSTDGPRLHDPRLSVEHVEQVPGYADQVVIPGPS